MLAIVLVVLVSTPVALSSPTCGNQAVEGASDPGECLLQPSIQSQHHAVRHTEVIAGEDGEEGDTDPEDEQESAEADDASAEDEDALEEEGDEDPEDENLPSAEDMSALQYELKPSWDPGWGNCGNWFGNNVDWTALKVAGIAEEMPGTNSGVWGRMLNQTRGLRGGKYKTPTNFCNWDRTAGASDDGREFGYYCYGVSPAGKMTKCADSKTGIRIDCVNGRCADVTQIKGEWSEVQGVGCARAKLVSPNIYLKSPKGKPQFSKWKTVCKVMCETIPECTGFTVRKLRRKPKCYFFGADHTSTKSAESNADWMKNCPKVQGKKFGTCPCGNWGKGSCCTHPHYNTYFVTRKSN